VSWLNEKRYVCRKGTAMSTLNCEKFYDAISSLDRFAAGGAKELRRVDGRGYDGGQMHN